MRLLLDENLPIKLRNFFSDAHRVTTVREQMWSGINNGKLLKLMQASGFDALVTMDKNLKYQQNLDQHNVK